MGRILDLDRTILSLSAQLDTSSPQARQQDLTMRQLLALHMLSAQPLHVGEIAEGLGVTISSASRLLDRLARSRLISRQRGPEDRRLVTCSLTADGETALREFLEMGRLRLERVLAELAQDQLETVEAALDLVISAATAAVARTGATDPPRRGRDPTG